MKKILVSVFLVVGLLAVIWEIQEREWEARQGRAIYVPLSLGAPSADNGLADLQWQLPRGIRSAIESDARRTSGELLLAVDSRGLASVLRFAKEDEELGPRLRLLHYEQRGDSVALGSTMFFLPEGATGRLEEVAFGELMVMADGDAVLTALCDRDRNRIDFARSTE